MSCKQVDGNTNRRDNEMRRWLMKNYSQWTRDNRMCNINSPRRNSQYQRHNLARSSSLLSNNNLSDENNR